MAAQQAQQAAAESARAAADATGRAMRRMGGLFGKKQPAKKFDAGGFFDDGE